MGAPWRRKQGLGTLRAAVTDERQERGCSRCGLWASRGTQTGKRSGKYCGRSLAGCTLQGPSWGRGALAWPGREGALLVAVSRAARPTWGAVPRAWPPWAPLRPERRVRWLTWDPADWFFQTHTPGQPCLGPVLAWPPRDLFVFCAGEARVKKGPLRAKEAHSSCPGGLRVQRPKATLDSSPGAV